MTKKTENPDRCSVTGDLRQNIFTAHIEYGDGPLIVPVEDTLDALRDYALPSDYDMECEHDEPDEDGTIQEITIKIKKCMTRAEVDTLPEKY